MKTTTDIVNLPPPSSRDPMVMRVISDPLFPDAAGQGQPVVWVLSQPHPFVKGSRVLRMFVDADRGGVEIYSIAENREDWLRHLIPMRSIRLVEEVMPFEMFVDELAAAEGEDDDDDDDGDTAPDELEPAQPSNGQVTP